MPVIKVRCPHCDTSLRHKIEGSDQPASVSLTCPKCNTVFTAAVASQKPPTGQSETRPSPANHGRAADEGNDPFSFDARGKRRDVDEDDDETPYQRKKRQQQSGANVPLIAGVVCGLLILIGGAVAAALMLGGNDKDKKTVKADDPAPAVTSPTPEKPGKESSAGGAPKQDKSSPDKPALGKTDGQSQSTTKPETTKPPTPEASTKPEPTTTPSATSTTPPTSKPPASNTTSATTTPSTPATTPPAAPNTTPPATTPESSVASATPGNPSGPGATTNPAPATTGRPPRRGAERPEPKLPPLPPPPKLRLNGTLDVSAESAEAMERPAPAPPLSPDEDPFVRAKNFKAEGALPQFPKLPPPNQRPVLALDSGGHTGFIQHVFIMADGQKVITVSEDKTVRVWDINTRTSVNTFRFPSGPGKEGSLEAAALSPKGRLAVSGTPLIPATPTNATAPAGPATTPAQTTPATPGTPPKNPAVPPKGPNIPGKGPGIPPKNTAPPAPAATPKAPDVPHVVFILNVATGTLLKTLNVAGEVLSLNYSTDGTRLAVGCLNGTVQVFDTSTFAQIGREDAPRTGPILEVRFCPEQKSSVLAILTASGQIKVLDTKVAKNNQPANPHILLDAGSVKPVTLAWSNDARFIAAGGDTGEIKVFEVAAKQGTSLKKLMNKTVPVHINQLQFLQGDLGILVGGTGSFAAVVDSATGNVTVPFTSHTGPVTAVTCSSDGKLVASSGGSQNETYVWNPADGKLVARLAGVGKPIWGIGWSTDGKSIAWGASPKVEDLEGNCPLEEIFRLDDLGPGGPAFLQKFQVAQTTDETFTIQQTRQINRRGQVIMMLAMQVGNKVSAITIPSGEQIFSVSILPGRGKAVIGSAHGLHILDLQTKEFRTLTGASGTILSVAPSPDGKYFVTGSSDQTIRIWQPEFDEPLMSIFVTGREWIAWTPQGYYACSPTGEKLLSWQINSSATKMPQVYPAARFRASMYQPALIKYLIPAGTIQYAMAMAHQFDKALVQTNSVADVMPPEVSFEASALAEDLEVDQDSYLIKASAKGTTKLPITAMRLLVDGRPFKGSSGIKRFDEPAETATGTWDVPLTPGPHTFAVIAETAVSKGMTKPITITRKGEVLKPNLYVLTIGVSDYPGKMKLKYSASDAKLLGGAFEKYCTGAFAKIEVRTITDKQATKKGIQDGLDWLASRMTAKDVGVVSFSGHGTRDEKNKFYLVPVDVNARDKDPIKTCFSGEEFKSRLDNMPGRLVAILDACHSGEVADHAEPPVSTDSLAQDLSSEDSGVIVLSASLGREFAIESEISKAGFFTLGLVEGLQGHADIDEDGVILITELETYAHARVRQLSIGRQHSTTSIPSGIRPFPLATVPKSK